LYEKFISIYEVTQDIGHVAITSPQMECKVYNWMANMPTALKDVANQVNGGFQKMNFVSLYVVGVILA